MNLQHNLVVERTTVKICCPLGEKWSLGIGLDEGRKDTAHCYP